MPTGTCPECDADVHVDLDTDKGEIVSCEECGTDLEVVGLDPVELDATLVDAVERAADGEAASRRRLASGAGHDAMLLARHVPTAMIFVPSRNGISHSPEEYTSPAQAELGMRVLAATLHQLLRPVG